MSFVFAILLCAAMQGISFYPFYSVWRADQKQYGSDMGVPLRKRFAAWCVACPVWAMPFAAMAGVI